MNLPAPAESLCLAHMAAEQAAGGSNEQLFLYIGLTNGVCQRVRGTKVISVKVNRRSSCAYASLGYHNVICTWYIAVTSLLWIGILDAGGSGCNSGYAV